MIQVMLLILMELLFNGATDSFNFKTKITGQTDNDGRLNNVEIIVTKNT